MSWLTTISPIVLGLTAIYCLLVLLLLRGLHRIRPGRNTEQYTVSVVVAAKNEEQAIGDCLQAVLVQDYPADKYDVVVVDDGSTDATAEIVRKFAQQDRRIKLLRPEHGDSKLRAKKRALQYGIENSGGQIVMITDADCRPPSTWISGMIRHFEPQVGLVAGHIREEGSTLGLKLRALERLSVAAVAAGAMSWGYGLTARGGNLSYRRKVFEEVGGLKTLYKSLSGDDDLFVQLVSRSSTWRLKYVLGPETAVTTTPPADLYQFLSQEPRRTSKGKYYPLWMQTHLVNAFLMNLSLAVTLPFSVGHPGSYPLPLIAFAGKVFCELLILIKAVRISKRKGLLRFFPMAAVLHIPYFLIFSIWGTLGGYRWKGKVDAG